MKGNRTWTLARIEADLGCGAEAKQTDLAARVDSAELKAETIVAGDQNRADWAEGGGHGAGGRANVGDQRQIMQHWVKIQANRWHI